MAADCKGQIDVNRALFPGVVNQKSTNVTWSSVSEDSIEMNFLMSSMITREVDLRTLKTVFVVLVVRSRYQIVHI